MSGVINLFISCAKRKLIRLNSRFLKKHNKNNPTIMDSKLKDLLGGDDKKTKSSAKLKSSKDDGAASPSPKKQKSFLGSPEAEKRLQRSLSKKGSFIRSASILRAQSTSAANGAEERCTALCDYEGFGLDELSFKKGDVITVISKGTNSGFWEGSLGDAQGIFPNCFVSSNMNPTRPSTFNDKCVAMFDYDPAERAKDGKKTGKRMKMQRNDLITIKAHAQDGWWWGINETDRERRARDEAHASGKKIELKDKDGKRKPHPKAEKKVELFLAKFVSANIVQAVYAFQGRQRCELTIEAADIIMLNRRWNDGWWEGYISCSPDEDPTLKSGIVQSVGKNRYLRRGIFPSNYCAPNVATLEPSLFCPKCRTVYEKVGTECKECIRNQEIVKTMQNTLAENTEKLVNEALTKKNDVHLDPQRRARRQNLYKKRLERFYNHYGETEKLKNIPMILVKYEDREVVMFEVLTMKYGPEPHVPVEELKELEELERMSVDLFECVDIEPTAGKGALLGKNDLVDGSVRPRLAS